jgi:hypothetical protein
LPPRLCASAVARGQGEESGNVWFDGRADYSGLSPVSLKNGSRATFSSWYSGLEDTLAKTLLFREALKLEARVGQETKRPQIEDLWAPACAELSGSDFGFRSRNIVWN